MKKQRTILTTMLIIGVSSMILSSCTGLHGNKLDEKFDIIEKIEFTEDAYYIGYNSEWFEPLYTITSKEHKVLDNNDYEIEYYNENHNIVSYVGGKIFGNGIGVSSIEARIKLPAGAKKESRFVAGAIVFVSENTTPIDSVKINYQTLQLEVGEETTFTHKILPVDADIKSVVWNSSNSNKATINQNGFVKAVASGSTTITLTVTDEQENVKTDSVELVIIEPSVEIPPLTDIKLNYTTAQTLEIGDTLNISATPVPSTAKMTISWSSSNDLVASVSNNGQVVAIKDGTTTITARDTTTNISKALNVTVKPITEEYETLQSVKFGKTQYDTKVGSSVQTSRILNPTTAKVVKTEYELEASGICTVSSNGNVTGVSKGSVSLHIFVTTLDQQGNQVVRSDTTLINVEENIIVPPTLTGIKITPSGNQSLKEGQTLQLSIAAVPTGANLGTVYYNSANTSAATISTSGKITAIKAGVSYISVTSGSVSAGFTLTVTDPSSTTDDPNAYNGYYSTLSPGLKGSALVSALKSLLSKKRTTSYDWTRFNYVDEVVGDTSSVFCLYSRYPYLKTKKDPGNSNDAWWNREHSYPESKIGKGSAAAADTHDIYACDKVLNSDRANKLYGVVNNSTYRSDGAGRISQCKTDSTYFEPGDSSKGEVARATLYLRVIDGHSITGNFKTEQLCFDWHNNFGVTSWEQTRSQRVFDKQGNRNPFVDFPHWAEICFSSTYSGPGIFR